MRKILALLLLVSLALIAVPQIVLAGEHAQSSAQTHGMGSNDDDRGSTTGEHEGATGEHGDHNEAGEHEGGEENVTATFHIQLEGAQQVGPVDTMAFGFARVDLIGNTSIEFSLVVCDIANVTHAHIHVGAAGTNGPIVVPFFDNPSNPVSTEGCTTLAEGTRGPSDLMTNAAAGVSNWDGFVHALLTNDTYVNVHTTAHPGGEIRGQLILHAEHEQDDNDGQQIEQGDAETNED
jgi:hypothetical protein